MSQSCDTSACDACLTSMSAVENTVCAQGSDVIGSICSGLSEASSDDPFVAFLAGVACGTAVGVGCQSVMEIQFNSQICESMFSDGCCGETAPTTICTSCPQDCVNAGKIVQQVAQQGTSQAMSACMGLYNNDNLCSNMINEANNVLTSSTASSFSILSQLTDTFVSYINPLSKNACSSCEPGCMTVMSMSLSPVVVQPVWGADIDAMNQAVQNVAGVIASHLVSRSTPLQAMKTNMYGAASANAETNVSMQLVLSSAVASPVTITSPVTTGGIVAVGAGSTLTFGCVQTFVVTGNYSVSSVIMSLNSSQPSVTQASIVPLTNFTGATLTMTYNVSFVMDSQGSYFTAVPFQVDPNFVPVAQPNGPTNNSISLSLSGIEAPTALQSMGYSDAGTLLTTCLYASVPLVVQNPPPTMNVLPAPASDSLPDLLDWIQPMCLIDNSLQRVQVVPNSTINSTSENPDFVWTNQFQPVCQNPIMSVYQYLALSDPQATVSSVLNYQPLSQLMGILSFVSTSLAYSLNAQRGQPGAVGHASNSTYVYLQGYLWAVGDAWANLYESPQVVPIKPRRPSTNVTGDTLMSASVNGIMYMCQIDSSGLMSAVPGLSQSWGDIWNAITWPFLSQFVLTGQLLHWDNLFVGLGNASASFEVSTSDQICQYEVNWNTSGATATNVNVTVTAGNDLYGNWTYLVNNTFKFANSMYLSTLLQNLLSGYLVYTMQLENGFG